MESSWALELEGRTYDLGLMHQVAATAQLDNDQPDDGKSVRLVPGEENTLVQRVGPPPRVDDGPTGRPSGRESAKSSLYSFRGGSIPGTTPACCLAPHPCRPRAAVTLNAQLDRAPHRYFGLSSM